MLDTLIGTTVLFCFLAAIVFLGIGIKKAFWWSWRLIDPYAPRKGEEAERRRYLRTLYLRNPREVRSDKFEREQRETYHLP